MTVKEFVNGYEKCADQSKKKYLDDNLKITTYIPFIRKDVIANSIVQPTTYKYEEYKKEDGTIGRRKTDTIQVNSTGQMILFFQAVIENYTNLKVETPGFFEEYDLLNKSGLLAELTVDCEDHPSRIPVTELSELQSMVQSKQHDILTNYAAPQNYIAQQIDKIVSMTNITLNPIVEKVLEKLDGMSDEDVEKAKKKIDKVFKVIK